MPTYAFIIAIVAIVGGLIYAAYEQQLKLQEKKLNNHANDDLLKEFSALKERVAVLEKIVTDEKYDLKNEINNLDRAS